EGAQRLRQVGEGEVAPAAPRIAQLGEHRGKQRRIHFGHFPEIHGAHPSRWRRPSSSTAPTLSSVTGPLTTMRPFSRRTGSFPCRARSAALLDRRFQGHIVRGYRQSPPLHFRFLRLTCPVLLFQCCACSDAGKASGSRNFMICRTPLSSITSTPFRSTPSWSMNTSRGRWIR